MNIRNLEQYVAQRNSRSKLFGSATLSLLNAEDRQSIANSIDSDMSPENLSCDGELSRAEVNRRAKFLGRCAEELRSIDATVPMFNY